MKGFQNYSEQIARSRIQYIEDELARADIAADVYQEAYSDAVRQMFAFEDIGWQALGGPNTDKPGNDLAQSKSIAEKLSDFSETNPLLKRGKEIRNSYLFSEPYEIGTEGAKSKITPQQRNIIDRPENQEAVFSLSALETIEGERFDGGNAFVLWDKVKKVFQRIPFDEIGDVVYDPFDKSQLRYIMRQMTYEAVIASTGEKVAREFKMWYPVSRYEPTEGYLTHIGDVPVDSNKRMIVSRVNLRSGSVFGLPDSFAAAPWALAYSAYLRDGTKVLAALAEWVWKITPKKRPAAERAAAAVRTERGAGGSIFTDMDVQALPKSDAVDLNTGRPLASQVAAALGISIVVLLADPGQSGAYGTAQTLADPNRRTMQARREVNTEFLKECLRLVGIDDPAITWAKMAPGSDLEEVQLLSAIWGTGLFEPEEVRPRLAKVGQITLLQDDAPDGVLVPNNAMSLARSDIDADGSTQSADGSNSMANGQGRDSLGVGNISHTVKDKTQKGSARSNGKSST